MALDDGENVSKIMSYSRREVPHGFHLLRLTQLRLQFQPLRNVILADERETLVFQSSQLGGEQGALLPALLGADLRFHVAERLPLDKLVHQDSALLLVGPEV